ncbi:hypothetical protein NDI43_12395 [Microcoleus vaginatus GB2-A3]|uniref:hypothetical protein n=1 Tax=Microcoleus vaginatus TaxID=119532 RepID=UPI0032A51FBD
MVKRVGDRAKYTCRGNPPVVAPSAPARAGTGAPPLQSNRLSTIVKRVGDRAKYTCRGNPPVVAPSAPGRARGHRPYSQID